MTLPLVPYAKRSSGYADGMTRARKPGPNWRIALIGVPLGLLLVGLGVALGLKSGGAAAGVLFFLGAGLIGGSPVVALIPAMRSNAKPSEHPHSTLGDMVRFIERTPHPHDSEHPRQRPTKRP